MAGFCLLFGHLWREGSLSGLSGLGCRSIWFWSGNLYWAQIKYWFSLLECRSCVPSVVMKLWIMNKKNSFCFSWTWKTDCRLGAVVILSTDSLQRICFFSGDLKLCRNWLTIVYKFLWLSKICFYLRLPEPKVLPPFLFLFSRSVFLGWGQFRSSGRVGLLLFFL